MDELGPIYEFARQRGYAPEAEVIIIEGEFPVLFIRAYKDLVREAILNSDSVKYKDVEVKIIKAEYLTAIALQTWRAKDHERAIKLLESDVVDRAKLWAILEKFGLLDRLKKIEETGDEK